MTDPYAATASAYELFAQPYRDAQHAALARLLPHLRPDDGPILDIGAGSGASVEWVLTELPTSKQWRADQISAEGDRKRVA